MSILFKRIAKLIVGTSSSEALVFDEQFRIKFDVKKDQTTLPTAANMQIYNLSAESRDKIKDVVKRSQEESKGAKVEPIVQLFAGYDNDDGYQMLFNGNITDVMVSHAPPDIILKLTCGDGAIPLKDSFINLSFNAGISSNEIIKQISSVLKMDINTASNYLKTNVNFANGYSFTGRAKEAMDKIMKDTGLRWTIEKNQILISTTKEPTTDTVIVLNLGTGLIGIPQKQENSMGDSGGPASSDGWVVKSLLQPTINPMRRIEIESKEIKGVFMVDSVEHKGDTRGPDWTSVVDVRSIKT